MVLIVLLNHSIIKYLKKSSHSVFHNSFLSIIIVDGKAHHNWNYEYFKT